MNLSNSTWLLKVAAICIAIPRTMGLSVAMLGIQAKEMYPLLIVAELWSGLGLAVLEGIAIAYVFSKWKQAKQDRVLSAFIVCFILTWPIVFAPYLVAEQDSITMSELTGNGLLGISLRLVWSGLVATLPMLIVAGVGYADSVVEPTKQKSAKKSKRVKFESPGTYMCPRCGRDDFASKQALGGHSKHCKEVADTSFIQLPANKIES